jgi:hypothetical protein
LEYDHKIAIILSIIYARVNERQGADIQTKVEDLEALNQSFRNPVFLVVYISQIVSINSNANWK